MIAGGFPTVALDCGASSFATALHIRERYAKYPLYSVEKYTNPKLDNDPSGLGKLSCSHGLMDFNGIEW